jgi:MSHA biogenesis protein MshN
MSVINQMLRDLDAREASSQERAGLPKRLRPLPPAHKRALQPWIMLAIGIAVGALVAGLLVGWWLKADAPSNSQTPLPLAAPVTAPTVATPPALSLVLPEAPAAPTVALPATTADNTKQAAQLAEKKPIPAAPPAAPATPLPTKPAATKKPATEPQPTPPQAAKPPAPTLVDETASANPDQGQIDKRSQVSSSLDKAEAAYRQGLQAVRRGDTTAAVAALEQALKLEPGHAKARQALLSVLVSGRQWPAAQAVAQSGLALDPGQTGWAIILARLQFEHGATNDALATLERHAAQAQQDAEYQSLFAYLLQKQQRYGEAVARFRAALQLRPGEGRWWFGLGLALDADGKHQEAVAAYLKARDSGNLPAEMAELIAQKIK